jgi:transposase-like protein
MSPNYRAAIAVYLVTGQHIDGTAKGDRAKSVRQIARELDMSATTVSRWLKSNHRDLWLKYWTA